MLGNTDLSARQVRVVVIVGALFASVFCGYAVYQYYEQTGEARAVDAVVEQSVVKEGVNEKYPHIEYRYTVNGTEYTSTRLCLLGNDCIGDVEELVETHEEGTTVTAYVDRTNPEDAYLIDPGPPYFMMIGAVLSALGALVVLRE